MSVDMWTESVRRTGVSNIHQKETNLQSFRTLVKFEVVKLWLQRVLSSQKIVLSSEIKHCGKQISACHPLSF
jgi:hypothetical protein